MAEKIQKPEGSESQEFDTFKGLSEVFAKSKELFGAEDLDLIDVHIENGRLHVQLSWTQDGTILLTTFKGGLGKIIYGEGGQTWSHGKQRHPDTKIDEAFCEEVKARLEEKNARLTAELENNVGFVSGGVDDVVKE